MKKNKGIISTGAAVGLVVLSIVFPPALIVTGPVLEFQLGKFISHTALSDERAERETWMEQQKKPWLNLLLEKRKISSQNQPFQTNLEWLFLPLKDKKTKP